MTRIVRLLAVVLVVVGLAMLGTWVVAGGPTAEPPRDGSTAAPSPSASVPTLRPAPSGSEEVRLVVDGSDTAAADDNDGTGAAPLATLAEAVERARAHNRDGRAVHVEVRPGTYRESVDLSAEEGATDAALVIEGTGDGEVVVSGSDETDGWVAEGEGVHRLPWDEDWGLGEVPASWREGYGGQQIADNPVVLRREMVFVDGELLVPHTSADAMRAEPGSFWVDEDADALLAHLPEGTDPATSTVEVARRDTLLTVTDRRNVTVRGLVLQHAASAPEGKAMLVLRSRDVVVEDVVLRWNSWMGLVVSRSEGVVVERTVANHNGFGGLGAQHTTDMLVVDSETSSNNWRGVRGAEDVDPGAPVDPTLVDFASGQKFLFMRGLTLRGHTAIGNQASGLWFDYDNRDVVVDGAVLRDNRTWGLFVEASPGPTRLEGLVVCGNEVGVHLANSADGVLRGSRFVDNLVGHVVVRGRATRTVVDGQTDARRDVATEHWTVEDNVFGVGEEQHALVDAGDEVWDRFVSTLRSDGNRFVGPTGPVVDGGGDLLDLPAWQRASGQDASSTHEDGTLTCSAGD